MSSRTYPPNSKHGIENHGMEFRNSYSGNERPSSLSNQHWQMEFKDATAAAQEAAESAERASMAARAAAELSSRGSISQQHPMESHMSPPHSMKDEELQKYTHSSSQNEHHARHPVNNSHHGRNSGGYKHSSVARSSDNSTHNSFKSTAASYSEKASVNNETADAYSQINTSEGRQMEHFTEPSINRNSGKNGMQSVNELHDIKNTLNLDHHEVRVGDQSSYPSSHFQSNTFTDDHNLVSKLDWQKSDNDQKNLDESRMEFENELHDTKTHDDHVVVSNLNRQKSRNDYDEDLFLPNDKGSLPRSTKETTDSFDNASAVFDDYRSDDYEDNFGLEEEHKVREYNINFSSPGQRSPTHPFTTGNSWRVQQNNSSPENSISKSHIFSEEWTTQAFFESSSSFSAPSNVVDLPATFDDYGPSSESEEVVDKSKFVRSSYFSEGKQNMGSNKPENKSSLTPQLAEGIEEIEHSNESNLEESKELKFGNLTGGLRNKGYRYPTYSKIPRDNVFSYGEAASDTSTGMTKSSPAAVEASVNSGTYDQEPYSRKGNDEVSRKLGPRALVNQVDSSDDGSEEQPKDTSSSIDGHNNITSIFEESKKSSSRGTVPYFNSGNNDSDEDFPKASLKAHSNTNLSRRTKASLPHSRRSSNYRTTVSSEPAVVFDHGEKKSLTTRSTDADEEVPKRQPDKKNSDNRESSQHSRLAPQPTSRPVSETKGSSVGVTLKSSVKEQQSAHVWKSTTSGSAKSLNAKTSDGEVSSKESANHVHPKLPDFDALTAHLNSLRQNR
ncbi:uncharacterized protein LOC120207344 [Hibiscus syriacus]|uniref:uncharacterized protein LOC120207344 n=1 Tax=Hibiscus syriacus TaxID=106335 RepID=UPI001923A941|nr:uncharacterized protein LOC120207344 [Hibiscus syriacus]XP_039062753.1 uncharacterized protein LOC120207344 [Hibiscus syriacus]